jgi:hypothetical protein
MYKIIYNPNNKTYYLVNVNNGKCLCESENIAICEKIKNKIDIFALIEL